MTEHDEYSCDRPVETWPALTLTPVCDTVLSSILITTDVSSWLTDCSVLVTHFFDTGKRGDDKFSSQLPPAKSLCPRVCVGGLC